MLVSFLIVNYKTENLTVELVESINRYILHYDYEILIFDNSPWISSKLNKLPTHNIKIYSKSHNIGFVKANNYLFNKAKGDIIFLINSDVLLVDNTFESMIDFFLKDDRIGIIGPMLLNSDKSYQVSFYKFPTIISLIKEMILLTRKDPYTYRTDITKIQNCDVIKGACLGFKKNKLPQDYLFDERIEMYSEEVDLCYRFHKSGYKNVYFPDCKVIHYGGVSSSIDDCTLKYTTYHYFRSKLLFFKKHKHFLVFLIACLIIMFSLIERIILFLLLKRHKQVKIFSYTFSKIFLGFK